jgi:hypothetical protein
MRFAHPTGLILLLIGLMAPVRADDKSHKAAAEELLKESKADVQFEKAIDEILNLQIKANPHLAQIRPAMKEFFDKYMSWTAMKDDVIKIYAEEFTEAELKEIATFYKTPTGKKMIEKMPFLLKKGMELGLKRMQENQAELKDLIRKALDK